MRWKPFELEAFDYILKPYQESRIINMLQKLTSAWQQQQQVDDTRLLVEL